MNAYIFSIPAQNVERNPSFALTYDVTQPSRAVQIARVAYGAFNAGEKLSPSWVSTPTGEAVLDALGVHGGEARIVLLVVKQLDKAPVVLAARWGANVIALRGQARISFNFSKLG
jgi:hypothetical protein